MKHLLRLLHVAALGALASCAPAHAQTFPTPSSIPVTANTTTGALRTPANFWTANAGAISAALSLNSTYQPLSGNLTALSSFNATTLPVSTATQGALDLKLNISTAASTYAPLSGPTLNNAVFTGSVSMPDNALPIADIAGLQTALNNTTNASNLTSGVVAAARGGAGTVNGILRANGSGVVSAAAAGTDFLSPTGSGAGLTNLPPTASRNRVVLLGDSITNQNSGPGTAIPNTTNGLGFFTWANIRLGGRMVLVRNAGVGGDRADQMLARLSADVLAHNPDTVIVLAGTNDVAQGATASVVVSRLSALYSAILAANKTLVVSTIGPADTQWASGQRPVALAVNRWIKEYATNTRGVIFADMGQSYTNPTASSSADAWKPAANTTQDGIHPTVLGALAMSVPLAAALDRVIPPVDLLSTGNYDATNLIQLAALAGTAPNVPTGMTSAQSAGTTWAYPVRTDGVVGTWAQVTTNSFATLNLPQVTSGFAEGQTIYYAVEYEYDQAGPVERINATMFANGSQVLYCPGLPAAYAHTPPAKGVIVSPTYTVGAGITSLNLYLSVVTSGGSTVTVRWGRPTLRVGSPATISTP